MKSPTLLENSLTTSYSWVCALATSSAPPFQVYVNAKELNRRSHVDLVELLNSQPSMKIGKKKDLGDCEGGEDSFVCQDS